MSGILAPLQTRLKALSWNLAGQAFSMLASLALIRLSVRGFSAQVYGTAALLLGVQALARGLAVNPFISLALYETPRSGASKGQGWVYEVTSEAIGWIALGLLPVWALLIPLLRLPIGHLPVLCGLLSVLLWMESVKATRFNLLHAQDLTRRYTIWILADSFSKPLLVGVVLLLPLARTPYTLLGGQVAGSALIFLLTRLDSKLKGLEQAGAEGRSRTRALPWARSHRAFLLPLAGLGLTGWITGVSDRYLVNAFLGPDQAGFYAAIYAIFGTVFLPLNGIFVLTFRPVLLKAQEEGRQDRIRTTLLQSLASLWLVALAMGLVLYLMRHWLVHWLLAPTYSAALVAVPGILLGSSFICLEFLLEQAFYLERKGGWILLKQASGSALALLTVSLAVHRWGLAGAGWACPVYAFLELLIGFMMLQVLWSRRGREARPQP